MAAICQRGWSIFRDERERYLLPVLRGALQGRQRVRVRGRLAAIAMTVKRAVTSSVDEAGMYVRNIVFHAIWYVAPGNASLLEIFDNAVLINYQSPGDEGFCKILGTLVSIVNL